MCCDGGEGWGGGRVVSGGGSGDCEGGIERGALSNSTECDFPFAFNSFPFDANVHSLSWFSV